LKKLETSYSYWPPKIPDLLAAVFHCYNSRIYFYLFWGIRRKLMKQIPLEVVRPWEIIHSPRYSLSFM